MPREEICMEVSVYDPIDPDGYYPPGIGGTYSKVIKRLGVYNKEKLDGLGSFLKECYVKARKLQSNGKITIEYEDD